MVQLVIANVRSSAKSNFIDFIFNLIYFTNIQKVYNLALTEMASFFSRFFLTRKKDRMDGRKIDNK
ncbi:hypothetical protein GCM10022388_05280 [Flavobacterium chungnamense]|uniref:Uncharacterized protein n=1 Tax=Flavobacterium chungnamense TaxID=706182 RepID=A0ABP7UH00_9FLAO